MTKLSPVKIAVLYWLFTLILYAFGPFDWITYRPMLFWGLMLAYMVFFVLGWSIGGRIRIGKSVSWSEKNDTVLLRRLGILICVNLCFEIVNLFRMFLFSGFDVIGLVARIIKGIKDMGGSYNSFQASVDASSSDVVGGMVVSILNYIWSIWSFSLLLLGIIYFKRLKFRYKIVEGITLLVVIVEYIAIGTNIGVFRVVLAFVVIVYIKLIQSKRNIFVRKKRNWKVLAVLVAAIISVLTLFDRIMQSRGGIAFWQEGFYNIGGVYIRKNSVFFSFIPKGFHSLLVSVAGYLSQGYYGLSLSMRVSWKPMYGIGFSTSLQKIIALFGLDISKRSYQSRIEPFGWDSQMQWHSLFTSLANDVSFLGVVFIMFFIGWLFRRSYQDVLELNNPYAKLVLYYLFLLVFFLPCNNQLAQTTYVLFSFVYSIIKWQTTKRGISAS